MVRRKLQVGERLRAPSRKRESSAQFQIFDRPDPQMIVGPPREQRLAVWAESNLAVVEHGAGARPRGMGLLSPLDSCGHIHEQQLRDRRREPPADWCVGLKLSERGSASVGKKARLGRPVRQLRNSTTPANAFEFGARSAGCLVPDRARTT